MVKKRFSVIFLIALLAVAASCMFVACEEPGDSPIAQLVISTQPKTTYYLGDSFDTSNSTVTVVYENGTTKNVALDIAMLSGFDPNVLGEQILTVRYENASTYIKVNVITPPVYSLEIYSTTHKTEYVVGESFSVDGLTMLVTYSNGRTAVVPVEESMVSGFDSTTAGQKRIVVMYGNKTCTMAVEILNKSIMEMQLVPPKKLLYIVGETLTFDGGYFFISYNDNSTEKVDLDNLFKTGNMGVLVTDEDSTTFTKTQATCTIRLYYKNREFVYAVSVEDLRAVELAVIKDIPDQIMGSEEINYQGGLIAVRYNDNSSETFPFNDEKASIDLTGFDLDSVGVYEISLKVAGATLVYSVKVIAPSPDKLVVLPEKVEYYQNEQIDITRWKYKVILNNGHDQRIGGETQFDVSEDMFVGNVETDIDNFKTGLHTYEFKVKASNGETLVASAQINILKKEIVAMDIFNEGKKIYSEMDSFSLANTYLQVTYNNGDKGNKISVTNSMLRADANGTPFDEYAFLVSAGSTRRTEKNVYVQYADSVYDSTFMAYYTITVVSKANSIALYGDMPTAKYVLGDEFDNSDWQILVTYSNNTTATYSGANGALDEEEWAFAFCLNGQEKSAFDEVGQYTVTLYYGGGKNVSLSYVVDVTNDIVDVFVDSAHLGFITEGEKPDLTDLHLYTIHENGERNSIPVTLNMVGGYTAPSFRSSDTSYISAYIDANVYAAYLSDLGEWVNKYDFFYVYTGEGYEPATATYSSGNDYRIDLAEQNKTNWNDVKFNFFDSANGTRTTGAYVEGKEYYINNNVAITIDYQGITATVAATITAKQVESVAIDTYRSEYVAVDSEWDIGEMRFIVRYNNGTANIVSGTRVASNPVLTADGDAFSYVVNGLMYNVEIGRRENGEFVARSFDDFLNEFTEAISGGEDIFYSEESIIRLTDYVTGNTIESDAFSVYCYDELIESISIIAGQTDGSDFTFYGDQTIYLNEGADLFENGFVVNDLGATPERESILSQVYVKVETESEVRYYSIEQARTLSSSFYTSGVSYIDRYQTLSVGFLNKEATIGLSIRENILYALEYVLPDETLSVIENMAIDPADIEIYAKYVDADGNMFTGANSELVYLTKKIDFRQVTCEGYSKTMNWTFAADETSKTVPITLSYGGLQANLNMTVFPKKLVGIRITTLPYKIQYVEQTDKTISYEGGQVSLSFDNGSTQNLSLDRGDILKNTAEFTSAISSGEELEAGAQLSYKIYISYTYRGVTKDTFYNVIIVDRKYVTIRYDSSFGYDYKLVCEYGSGASVLPDPVLTYYYRYTDISPTELEPGNENERGYYHVQYRDSNGHLSETWPTEVGIYTVRYSYFCDDGVNGDEYNNAFSDETITLQIVRKQIAIRINEITVSYGDVLSGDEHSAFVTLTTIGANEQPTKYWTMTAVENGMASGDAYCYDDSDANVLQSVSFDILSNRTGTLVAQAFGTATKNGVKKLVVNAPAGTYVIRPNITLYNNSNYELSPLVNSTLGTLVIEKRKVVIVAEAESKAYGQNDPDFGFRVYEYADVADIFGEELLSELGSAGSASIITASSVFDEESNGLTPIGSKSGIYFMFSGSNYNGSGSFDSFNPNILFKDVTSTEYHLTRDVRDSENVSDEHEIHKSGLDLSNYDVCFIGNYLTIVPSELRLSGNNLTKYFGTLTFATGGVGNKMTFKDVIGYGVVNNDNFASLFVNYFDNGGLVVYYNTSTHLYDTEIVGYADDWVILYKNVRIFKDELCENLAFPYETHSFSIGSMLYSGKFTSLPVNALAGTYYVVIDTDNIDKNINTGLKNYEIAEITGYSFTMTIKQTVAYVNTESFVVTGTGTYKDQKNTTAGRRLYSYFNNGGIEIRGIDRSTYDTEIDDEYKNAISSIVYKDENGLTIAYKLDDSRLLGEFTFVRGDLNTTGINTGIHPIVADNNGYTVLGNTVCDFTINVISYYDSVPYVEYFYDVWGSRLDLPALGNTYTSEAYLVVLPEYVDILPNENDVVFGEYNVPQITASYTRMAYKDLSFDTYLSLDGSNYSVYNDTGISYSLLDATTGKSLGQEEILNVGTYKGKITYSFFDTTTKNYLYIGDTAVVDSSAELYILRYVFDTTYEGDRTNNALIYTAEYTYILMPAEVNLSIESIETEYNGTSQTVNISIIEGTIYEGDSLSLTFNVDVLYNGETESTLFSEVAVTPYRLAGETVTETGALSIQNSGTYTISVANAGDTNYQIHSSVPGTINILPISVPIYIKTGTNSLTVENTYAASNKGINPISNTWKGSSDPESDYTFRTDGSVACYIVKEYYVDSTKYTTNTSFDPSRDLTVSTAQEDGSYPKYVKRDEEGNIVGYPITYTINNSTYNNYTIIFVKKVATTYMALDEDERYELVIKPKNVKLYNFGRVNEKEYDGNPAAISGTNSNLTFQDAYNSDPIVRSGVQFVFYRPESSMMVGSYKYINDVEGGFTARDNIVDAGILHVKVTYEDANGNKNYNIIFADDSVCYVDGSGIHNDIAVYTIRQATVTFDLKNVIAEWQGKQYDGYGLLNPADISYTADASGLPLYGNLPVDDLSLMHYKFVIKRFGTTLTNSTLITATDAQITATAYNGTPFDVGYYWYDLRGVFYDEETEKYITFESCDPNASDWLSWNYRYSVQAPTNNRVNYNGCDGIYEIQKRDVYIVFNATDLPDGTLDVAADSENAPKFGVASYNYKITYDGRIYQSSAAASFGSDSTKTYCDFIASINDTSDSTFTYGLYSYDVDTETFKNVSSIVNLDDYFADNIAGLASIFSSCGENAIQEQNLLQVISANISSLMNANPNFNIVNSTVSFSVRTRPINVTATLVRISNSELSEMVFGTEFDGITDGLYFRFSLNDDLYYSEYDSNLTDLHTIVENIINQSVGSLSLINIDDREERFSITQLHNLSSQYWFTTTEGGKTYSYVKVLDSFITSSSQTKPKNLPANLYDEFNEAIPRYMTAGSGLTNNNSRYTVNVTGSDFVVTRKEVTITGVRRVYFNKDTDSYIFKVQDIDESIADSAISFYSGSNHNMKDYIYDNTPINANVGMWTTTNKDYYIRIPISQFKINNSNYIVALDTTGRNVNAADINAWNVAQPVYIGVYVYIPLEIVKANVTINYIVANNVSYGDMISPEQSIGNTEIRYVNLPVLSELGVYYYADRSVVPNEVKSEEGVFGTGKYNLEGQEISLANEQRSFKQDIINVIRFNDIIAAIAYSAVDEETYSLNLIDYVDSTPVFDNYEVTWGVLEYTIVKKNVSIAMTVLEDAYTINSEYFSALWSERDSLFYSDGTNSAELRLGYGVSISNFMIYTKLYNTLGEQMAAILGATKSDNQYTYKGNTYSSLLAFMEAICHYKIYMYSGGSDILATSGGDVRYIALYGLESSNFNITFVRSGIMLYPEIIGMGKYVDSNGKYVNLIPNTEASNSDVTIDFTRNNRISGLSMLFRLNFDGLTEEDSIQYVDTNKDDDYIKTYYAGMQYDRRVYLEYIPDYSASLITSERPLRTGDVITVKLYVEESFYNREFVTTFESPFFEISIKGEGSSLSGYRETMASKADTTLKDPNAAYSEGYGAYLSSTDNVTYYIQKNDTDIEEATDIININARLIPGTLSGNSAFEIIVYENSFGTLVLGFDGTKNYSRMFYNYYYIAASNNMVNGKYLKYDDAEFFTFESAVLSDTRMNTLITYYEFANDTYTATSDTSFVAGKTYYVVDEYTGEYREALLSDALKASTVQYFERIGNGFILTSDSTFTAGKSYFVVSQINIPDQEQASYTDVYVKYSESRISDELVSIFDGNNHSFSIFLDKVGAFTNVVRNAEDPRVTTFYDDEYPEYGEIVSTMISESFYADRLLTLRVLVDNTTYIFTYIGEPYSYTYSETKLEFPNANNVPDQVLTSYTFYTAGMFSENGKTGIRLNNVKAMINKFSLQYRYISTVNHQGSSYIANVVFWPMGAEDSDVMYVTNEKTARSIFELMDTIGNVTISGGEDAFDAYNVQFSDDTKVVSVTTSTVDIANHTAVVTVDPGLYTITYTSQYHYRAGNNTHAVTLATNRIRILVTENTSKQLTLLNMSDPDLNERYLINSSSPQTFGDGTYLTRDIQTDMRGSNALTYIFDSVNFSGAYGDIWLYFKLSDTDFTYLVNKNEDLTDAVGIAFRITKNNATTSARVIISQQKPIDDGSRYSSWRGNEQEITFSSSVINILKIDVGTKMGFNTGNLDFNGADTVISFRLYQHNTATNVTQLVFEEYVRPGFADPGKGLGSFYGEVDGAGLSRTDIDESLFEAGLPFYTGLMLESASIRLMNLYKGITVENGMDYVGYSITNAAQVLMQGDYLPGDSVIEGRGVQSYGLTDQGKVYMLSDKYNVPYSYSGNTVSLRFKLTTEQVNSGGFRLYFALNTPYVLNITGGTMDSNPRRQRGLILEYNAATDKLLFYYFKYNKLYLYQEVLDSASQKLSFNDGEEHAITIFIDTDNIYNMEEAGRPDETYLARILIDRVYVVNNNEITQTLFNKESDVYVPISNNFTGLSDMDLSQADDNEQSADYLFLKGIYYMGIEAFANSDLEVLDCIAFEQTGDIFH